MPGEGRSARFRAEAGLGFDPRRAARALAEADPALGRHIERVGPIRLRTNALHNPFSALTEAIVYQQLSGKAAETILGRVCALFHPRRFPRPEDLRDVAPERLRGAGLSRAKVLAVQDLAARALDGTVPSLARLKRMADEEIVERLTSIRGVGPWTVEMMLIFRLGRPDVLPVHDYGVRKGFARVFRTRGLPTPKQVSRRGERWRPYRTAAAWYLWRALDPS